MKACLASGDGEVEGSEDALGAARRSEAGKITVPEAPGSTAAAPK